MNCYHYLPFCILFPARFYNVQCNWTPPQDSKDPSCQEGMYWQQYIELPGYWFWYVGLHDEPTHD